MQKVNSCCCGCSLKTGTLIILILTLILSILELLGCFGAPGNQAGNIIGLIIILGITIAGIYAATQEKPVFLIPYMVILLLGLVGLIISMLAVLIFSSAVIGYLAHHATDAKQADEFAKAGFIAIVITEVFCGGFAALFYYCFIVVLSFFKSLRSGSQ
ncbi:uncharacterized protein LOC135848766 isoform X2 [Planococcus citri]|uniref:uncharacterized protein LOC135848766 isoform X2 n=1 Tax=Planococcus citri TaxID=170843 RepID=UPI0031F732AA